MKKLYFLLTMSLTVAFTMSPLVTFSQLITTNPDTVCYQTAGSIYQVPNTPGYTYTWTVATPGIMQSGQGTNQINVDWSNAAPGTIINGITVFATDANGCTSTPVTLNIFIYQVIPTITNIGPFCQSEPCINLSATPAGGTFTGLGVSGNQFCPNVAGPGTHTITYTVTANGCTFTATTTVTVNAAPVLTPIQHN